MTATGLERYLNRLQVVDNLLGTDIRTAFVRMHTTASKCTDEQYQWR